MSSVFLSYPAPINKTQSEFIDKLREWLQQHGFLPHTLGITDYSDAAPLQAIRSLMMNCNGLICVAFRRTYIEKGTKTVRAGLTHQSKPIEDQWITSPWSHIEPSMAYQIGLPILILREAGVIDDGILEKGVVGLYLPEFDLTSEDASSHYLLSAEWVGIGTKWEQHVRNVVVNKGKPPVLF